MTIQQLTLRKSIHFRGAYRDYIHRDHKCVESFNVLDCAVEVNLTNGKRLVIPNENVAATMHTGGSND